MKLRKHENKPNAKAKALCKATSMCTLSSFNDSKTSETFVKLSVKDPSDPTKETLMAAPLNTNEATALIRKHYKSKGQLKLKSREITSIKDDLASDACDSPVEEVFGRWFKKDGIYYIVLDLHGKAIIKVVPGSVDYTSAFESKVNIYLTANNREIPGPIKDVDIEQCLKEFQEIFRLKKFQVPMLVASMLSNFMTDTPNMLTLIIGPEGSGKTVLSKFIVELMSPCLNAINSIPDKKGIVAYAKSNPILGFDNLSELIPKLQDLFCTILTGISVSERKNYSNHDMAFVVLSAPIVMSAISLDLRPDLAERAIIIDLTNVTGPKERLSVLNEKLEQLRPRMFSALINLFAKVLVELPSIQIVNPTRMADYEALGEAIGKCLGYKKPFSDIYKSNLRKSAQDAVNAQPAIQLVMKIVRAGNNGYEGTYGELLTKVRSINYLNEPLPRSGKAFSELLRRHEKALNKLGFVITRPGRSDAGQLVHITYSDQSQ